MIDQSERVREIMGSGVSINVNAAWQQSTSVEGGFRQSHMLRYSVTANPLTWSSHNEMEKFLKHQ
jgi:hypothetical protein